MFVNISIHFKSWYNENIKYKKEVFLMTKDTKKILLAILSFFIPIIGIILYFIYTPKKDAKLFGLLGLIGIVLWVFGGIRLF